MNRRSIGVVVLVGLVAVVGLVSCFPVSLHPLVDEKNIVFEESLLGVWVDASDPDEGAWHFNRGEKGPEGEPSKAYSLVVTDEDGKGSVFTARLGKVGEDLYLDLFPEPLEVESGDLQALHVVPVHSFLLVEQIIPVLKMRFLDQDWLEGLLEDKPEALAHTLVEEQLVLTADTAELQAFLRKHRHTEGAFLEPSNLTQPEPQKKSAPGSGALEKSIDAESF